MFLQLFLAFNKLMVVNWNTIEELSMAHGIRQCIWQKKSSKQQSKPTNHTHTHKKKEKKKGHD